LFFDATFSQLMHLLKKTNNHQNLILMKISLSFILFFSVMLLSCSDDDTTNQLEPTSNKVALLKIDYLTQTFEGGKELTFDASTDFNISYNYYAPGDFGSVELMYEELDETLFDGTIIWMGLGARSYPTSLMSAEDFQTVNEPLAMPSNDMFENVMYSEYAYYPEDLDYSTLWNSIADLSIVEEYRSSNPNATINVFLYTPSVGAGDPADWDYYVILKN